MSEMSKMRWERFSEHGTKCYKGGCSQEVVHAFESIIVPGAYEVCCGAHDQCEIASPCFPVSKVNGEELLVERDAALQGLIPFDE